MNKITTLSTPLVHSGIIFQSQVHLENILESLGPEITRSIFDSVIGKKGTFEVLVTFSLAENIALNTLTMLYSQAKIEKVENDWQSNMYYLINNFVAKDIL
jgi:hypothetical protein